MSEEMTTLILEVEHCVKTKKVTDFTFGNTICILFMMKKKLAIDYGNAPS